MTIMMTMMMMNTTGKQTIEMATALATMMTAPATPEVVAEIIAIQKTATTTETEIGTETQLDIETNQERSGILQMVKKEKGATIEIDKMTTTMIDLIDRSTEKKTNPAKTITTTGEAVYKV
jgi:hypothetical protein